MKSAYELAMERLEKSSPITKTTDEQKARIAEIDETYRARIAEKEVFLQEQIVKSAGDPAETDALRRQLSLETARLREECEEKKDAVRSTPPAPPTAGG